MKGLVGVKAVKEDYQKKLHEEAERKRKEE